MNHSQKVDLFFHKVESIPNISEGNLQLQMNLGDTAFRGVKNSAMALHPELKRNKMDKVFRYNIIDEDNTIQVSLEQTIGISQDWESEL